MGQELPQGHAKKAFKKNDIWLALGLLALAAGLFFWFRLNTQPGATARLTLNGAQVYDLPLDQDGIFTFQGRLPITIEVADGAARFVQSQCPDHLCEGFGWVRDEGQTADCLPGAAHLEVPVTG